MLLSASALPFVVLLVAHSFPSFFSYVKEQIEAGVYAGTRMQDAFKDLAVKYKQMSTAEKEVSEPVCLLTLSVLIPSSEIRCY